MLNTLKKRNFPVGILKVFASPRSAGSVLETAFGPLTLELFDVEEVKKMDFCLMAVSGDFSLEYAKQIAVEGGAIVIDNSSAWRYDPEIPLCVPEINPEKALGSMLIANPNCTTAIAAVALYPIYKNFGLKRVIVSTYQVYIHIHIFHIIDRIESNLQLDYNSSPFVLSFSKLLSFGIQYVETTHTGCRLRVVQVLPE